LSDVFFILFLIFDPELLPLCVGFKIRHLKVHVRVPQNRAKMRARAIIERCFLHSVSDFRSGDFSVMFEFQNQAFEGSCAGSTKQSENESQSDHGAMFSSFCF
jgi:hypothetical protein